MNYSGLIHLYKQALTRHLAGDGPGREVTPDLPSTSPPLLAGGGGPAFAVDTAKDPRVG